MVRSQVQVPGRTDHVQWGIDLKGYQAKKGFKFKIFHSQLHTSFIHYNYNFFIERSVYLSV